jgi:PAS domain S-box-containing protein
MTEKKLDRAVFDKSHEAAMPQKHTHDIPVKSVRKPDEAKTAGSLTEVDRTTTIHERHTDFDGVPDADDHYSGAARIAGDIAERRRAEAALRESENRYHMLFKKMLEGCALHEIVCNEKGVPIDYRYLDVNPAFETITGFKAVDIIGKTALEIAHDIDPFFIETYGKVALTGEPVTFEFYNNIKDRHFVITAYQPQERQFACVFQNVTEQKQTEKALRESEQKFRVIAENQIAGIFITQGRKIVYANDRLAEMHGYRKEEILGKPYYILIHPSERKTIKARMQKRLMTPPKYWQRFKVLRLKKNGESFWSGLLATKGSYNGKPAIVGSVMDISKTIQAEEELEKARDELETRVQERTRALQKANDDLNEKTQNLEDLNIALKILLDKREKDKEENGEQILLNVKEFLIPYVIELKNGPLTDRQRNYVGLLESGLQEIISPFAHKLTSRYMNITPREMQVANLVKEGKTSKEIAGILCTTERTVVAHRANLRKKLGLKKKSNLRTYLISLK